MPEVKKRDGSWDFSCGSCWLEVVVESWEVNAVAQGKWLMRSGLGSFNLALVSFISHHSITPHTVMTLPETELVTASSVCSRHILYPQLLQALEFCWECLHIQPRPWVGHFLYCSSLCHQHLSPCLTHCAHSLFTGAWILSCDSHVEVSHWAHKGNILNCCCNQIKSYLVLSSQVASPNHSEWEYLFRKPEQGKVNPCPNWS